VLSPPFLRSPRNRSVASTGKYGFFFHRLFSFLFCVQRKLGHGRGAALFLRFFKKTTNEKEISENFITICIIRLFVKEKNVSFTHKKTQKNKISKTYCITSSIFRVGGVKGSPNECVFALLRFSTQTASWHYPHERILNDRSAKWYSSVFQFSFPNKQFEGTSVRQV
jgi:hypothetical protein